MPIYPLPVLTDEDEQKALEKLRPPKTVVVRYGYLYQIGEFPYDGDQILGCGTKLIVRTPRGVELGEMLTTTCTNSGCGSSVSRKQLLDYIDNSGGKLYPFTTDGKVLRVATPEDFYEKTRMEAEKPGYIRIAKQYMRELDLPMKLVDVEPLISRDRIVFYFTAETRIDFRELVRRLAADLHVRIEMRQVGARDEARIVADYEKCGQHCCCKQFLKVLKPVSMKSAKVQKATLDPAKISGRCGRLMCCLRYEDETYDELRKKLPHRNSRVMTDDGPGTVVSTQILTQLALIELDADGQRNAYPVENLEKLTGDAAKPPPPREERGGRSGGQGGRDGGRDRGRGRDAGRDGRREGGGTGSVGGVGGVGSPGGPEATAGRDKRDEPRRPQPGRPLRENEIESREGEPADAIDAADMIDSSEDAANGATDTVPPGEGQAEGDQPRRKRRRRRRRRRGGGADGDTGGDPQAGGNDGPSEGPGEGPRDGPRPAADGGSPAPPP